MQSLNDLLKKKLMSKQIRGKGTTIVQEYKKKGCVSCSQKFDKNGN